MIAPIPNDLDEDTWGLVTIIGSSEDIADRWIFKGLYKRLSDMQSYYEQLLSHQQSLKVYELLGTPHDPSKCDLCKHWKERQDKE